MYNIHDYTDNVFHQEKFLRFWCFPSSIFSVNLRANVALSADLLRSFEDILDGKLDGLFLVRVLVNKNNRYYEEKLWEKHCNKFLGIPFITLWISLKTKHLLISRMKALILSINSKTLSKDY